VKETPSEIIFLRHVEPGSADKSYGIEVARLAGLPRSVIERAREVLKRHEQSEHELSETLSPGAAEHGHSNGNQAVMFTPLDRAVLERLRAANLDDLKPLDALNLLADLKKQSPELEGAPPFASFAKGGLLCSDTSVPLLFSSLLCGLCAL